MFSQGDIVVVKFVFTESKGYKWRPAVVVSNAALHKKFGLCWVVMITSQGNEPWEGDIPIPHSKDTGLEVECVVRPAKIAATQLSTASKIGKLPRVTLHKVLHFVGLHLK